MNKRNGADFSHNSHPETANIGKTIIVTGANGSIGAEIVRSLLEKGFSVVMACRNLNKGEAIRSQILRETKADDERILLEALNLSSFASIHSFVNNIVQKKSHFFGLMNNAGTLNRHYKLTQEGFEDTVGVNYVGIFLLTKLLLPNLEKGANIVNVISMTTNPKRIDKEFFSFSPEKFRQLRSYGQSKTALLLFTAFLSEKTAGQFHVNAADPGIVDTNIIKLHRWFDVLADWLFRPLIKSPRKGAIPLVNAQITALNGHIFVGNKNKKIPTAYTNHPLKNWLWDETDRIISEIELNYAQPQSS